MRASLTQIQTRLQRLPGQGRPILLTCAYGLSAGLGAVAFQWSISWIYGNGLVRFSHESPAIFLAASLALLVASSLVVGFLLNRFAPEASGSGIPQLKLAFWKDFGYVPWRVVWVKYVAGVLSIGGGCSLGREGPSVQLAGGLASTVAGGLGEAKQSRRLAAAAGAAAGLAAAFNTPLAAVTFVLEEIIDDLNSSILGSVLLASVIGAFVVHGLIGRQPAFELHGAAAPGWLVYLLIPLVSGIASVAGMVFQKATFRLRKARKHSRYLPPWARPVLGGVLTWAIGSAVFLGTGHLGVFSLGYDDLTTGLAQGLGWKIALILLVAKLAATVFCYGFGGCGGIFSPTLFFGGMVGICLGKLFALELPVNGPDQLALAVVGMSACLGAVVRAPVTGILIVFEMTHEFSLVPALMLGALVSQAISRKLSRTSFYQEVLLQDGHHIERVIPPRDLKSWHELPVASIANFQPVILHDLSRPALEKALESSPYERFPVVETGRLRGVLSSAEARAALREHRPCHLEPAVTAHPDDSIGAVQNRFVDSAALMIVVVDRERQKVLAVLTLHDVLRAQANFSVHSSDV